MDRFGWWVMVGLVGMHGAFASCDLCAIESATESAGTAAGIIPMTGLAADGVIKPAVAAPATLAPKSPDRLTVALFGEHRRAGTLRQDGRVIADPAVDTTSLQLVAGWRLPRPGACGCMCRFSIAATAARPRAGR